MINVVMMVYNRPKCFGSVLQGLIKQTVKFKLHIISNKPENNELFLSVIDKFKKRGMDIEFFAADNSKMTAERWHYIKNNLLNTEYVIFVDDDMLLYNDSIEKLWNMREKNTMKIFEGRQFLKEHFVITQEVFNNTHSRKHNEFSYGALNFGILDTAIFHPSSYLFEMEKKDPKLCYDADDLVISWVINKNGGKIINHKIFPRIDYGVDDIALHKLLSSTIYKKYAELDDHVKFKRF